MKKTCKDYGSDGKGKGRAWTRQTISKLVKAYIDGGASEAMDWARALCHNEVDAEDLVQEALYRTLRSGGLYDRKRSFSNWVLAILRNAFRDSKKRKERRDVSLDGTTDNPGEDEQGSTNPWRETLTDNTADSLERLQRTEVAAQVTAALRRLSKKHQDVLRLCDMEGASYGEASEALGVPLGTIRSRLARARAAFAAEISKTDLK